MFLYGAIHKYDIFLCKLVLCVYTFFVVLIKAFDHHEFKDLQTDLIVIV